MTNFLMNKYLEGYASERSEDAFKNKKMNSLSIQQGELIERLLELASLQEEETMRSLLFLLEETANEAISIAAIAAYKIGLQDGFKAQRDFESFVMKSNDEEDLQEVEQ